MGHSKKKRAISDPFFEREQEKYASPIPSREYILKRFSKLTQFVDFPVIRDDLAIAEESEQEEALRRRLKAMVRDGQLMLDPRTGYGLIDKDVLIKGRVIGKKEGDGLLITEDEREMHLSARDMRRAMHNDVVLVREGRGSHRGRREAIIVEVVEHGVTQIVGRLAQDNQNTIVIPEDKRIAHKILIPEANRGKAQYGQLVVAYLTEYPHIRTQPIAEIIEVLGDYMAPGVEIDVALRRHDIPHEWPKALWDEVNAITFEIPKREYTHRVDLRELPLVTIDGEDAKDFDDAVYCEKKRGGGWRLWVAIADVSYYVRPDTLLDEAAQERGNSVYFPGKVIPMLPEILSNGVCSLNPEVERRCMVCEMTVSQKGKLSGYTFYPAVINSHARLTYTQVGRLLEDEPEHYIPKNVEQPLKELHALYQVLREQRLARGALEFESPEPVFLFSDDKKIDAIVERHRNDAHKLIEECMILANISAAKFIEKHEHYALVRNHIGPSEKKLEALQKYLQEKGLRLPGGLNPTPKDYAELLQSVEHRLDYEQVQTMLLRSMTQAVYQPQADGHFGLALEEYAHFTSPIRRYPDLIVHRTIKKILSKITRKRSGLEGRWAGEYAQLDAIGEHCSFTERRAEEATRDVSDWLKCEFMMDKVGQHYTGKVTSVTSFGLFVRLDTLYIEGLIHITQLTNDYYHFDAAKMVLIGENTRLRFGLGDTLDIIVSRVDLETRQIDFELTGLSSSKPLSRKKSKSQKISSEKKLPKSENKKDKTKKKKKPEKNVSKRKKARKKRRR
ncbi:MAG: ribonuclease R [Pseudomonadota bacterium]